MNCATAQFTTDYSAYLAVTFEPTEASADMFLLLHKSSVKLLISTFSKTNKHVSRN